MHLKFRGSHLGFFHFRFGRTVFPVSPSGMLDLKNVCLAVGISIISCWLPCLEAEIHAIKVFRPPYWIFPLPIKSHSIPIYSNGKLDPNSRQRRWKFIDILSVSGVITPFILIFFFLFYNFRFCGRHIGILDDDGNARIVTSHSPDIFRKSHQRISVYYMWFRNGSEKIGLGGNFTPRPPVKL